MAVEDGERGTRRRLLATGLGIGLVVAVGCTTKSSTTTPAPTPPTPGQFAPSSSVVTSMSTISMPTTTRKGNTIGG